MSIVILGDGLLASELIKQTLWENISRKKDGFDISAYSLYSNFFLQNFDSVAYRPKYTTIVNCIANTDTYSDNKNLHWNINYKSVVELANFCSTWGIKLVHISTDHVYSNSEKNASEDSIPIHGDTWYSYTKLLGDSYVQLNESFLVLRGTHKPFPFPYPAAWIDQVGNFDYTDKIAKLYIDLIQQNATGVYNVGTNVKTMLDLARSSSHDVDCTFVSNKCTPTNTSMNISKLNKFLNI